MIIRVGKAEGPTAALHRCRSASMRYSRNHDNPNWSLGVSFISGLSPLSSNLLIATDSPPSRR
jgi:hypothetical protein